LTFLVDTNACIAYLPQGSAQMVSRISSTKPSSLALCSVVKYELIHGARKSAKAEENLKKLDTFFAPLRSFSFDDGAATVAGEVRATLERQGTPIGPHDPLAAIAIAYGLTLVTHNTSEFGRIAGLPLEDWEA
jgi:tRNA(fMet)-specific endonuclease VapC